MKCQTVKSNGKTCGCHAMPNGFCYFHNPDIPEDSKFAARVLGGQKNALEVEVPLPPLSVRDATGVTELLETVINEVRSGRLDIRVANTLGFLAGQLLKAYELKELDGKVEVIERAIFERRLTTNFVDR